MIYLKSIVLAIVEGLTEFIPVSSTGHLILVEAVVKLSSDESFNVAFMVIIQLPAILAVIVYFRNDIWPFTADPHERARRFRLWGRIALAVVPALILGSLFADYLEERLFHPFPVACALAAGGVMLILLERLRKNVRFETVHDIPLLSAVFIGLFQCFAMFPGTSRSASSIIGGMLLGASRPAAAEFSFFLAIPTMLAATGYTLAKHGLGFTGEQWAVIAVGSVVSFFVAWASIAFLMSFIRRHSFALFGYYRIVLAGVVLAALWAGILQ
jgi:undecaprenyl-diphosphatase